MSGKKNPFFLRSQGLSFYTYFIHLTITKASSSLTIDNHDNLCIIKEKPLLRTLLRCFKNKKKKKEEEDKRERLIALREMKRKQSNACVMEKAYKIISIQIAQCQLALMILSLTIYT